MKKRDRENLNPTPEAVIAMEIFCDGYANQRGGSMDFWDSLYDSQKDRCRLALAKIRAAERAHKKVQGR